jgi:hypothetical protein
VNRLLRDYDFEERHLRVLVLAAECWDRLTTIRAKLEGAELTMADRYGLPKTNPLLIEERAQKKLFAQLVRELGLDLETETPRLPARGG